MIITVGDAFPRQAGRHFGDGCDKWKHLLNDVTYVADQTGTFQGNIGRVEMCSTLSTLADQSPYSRGLLRSISPNHLDQMET